MKPSDLTVVLNGLEVVAKAFINVNGAEINKILKNSSMNHISKTLISSMEEKLSSAIAYSEKPNALLNIATEVKERGAVVKESVKQYSAFVLKQNSVIPKEEISQDLDIDHPIIKDDVNFTEVDKNLSNNVNVPPIDFKNFDPKSSSVQTKIPVEEIKVTLNSTESQIPPDTVPSPIEPPVTLTAEEVMKAKVVTAKPRTHTLSKLSDRARERKVPSSRIGRMMSYGGLAAGMGMGAVAEVARRKLGLKTGKDSEVNSLLSENPFLTEANANRIVDTLCKVRGAALKLGQMLSLQDNAMINPQLAAVFERVRQSADFMPSWQMERVLTNELGHDWQEKLQEFDSKPFAAASIGQVHRAKLLDSTEVAIKIQYPGVAEGIESDIKSLMGIINLWNILPKGMYLENVMSVAKRELRKEVDYVYEAQCGKHFKELLEPYPEYQIPTVYDELCTSNILVTELVYGTPIDKLESADQDLRNQTCERLLKLCLMEIFLFHFMQTDPNWSNFLYNYDTDKIVLLDFGACNKYEQGFVDIYMNIIKGAADQNREDVLRYSQELGFLTGYETKVMEEAHVDAVMILGEAFACKKPFDFRQQNMTQRIHHLVPIMLKHRLTPPPEETYSLHRKMSGIFLLCTKLGAIIDCSKLFGEVHDEYMARKEKVSV